MKLSVIIPYMESYSEKREILKTCVNSFIGADEIIIVSNWREGYAKPINKGCAVARGDFIVVMNDDLVWDGGSLKRLCDETAVTSPVVNGKSQPFWGFTWCMPRWVYEKTGGMDEGYRISYFDDDHFIATLMKLRIPMHSVPDVQVTTKGGTTLDAFPDRNEFYEENKRRFISIWGYEPRTLYDFFDRNGRLPDKGEI